MGTNDASKSEGQGKFVVFEGPDGCGKTTQIDRVANSLVHQGLKVATTRQPGGTQLGVKLREIIKSDLEVSSIARRALFAADRINHQDKIRRLLDHNDVVLCDRIGFISDLCYSGAEGCDDSLAQEIRDLAAEFEVRPDLVLIFDVPQHVCFDRTDHEDKCDADESTYAKVHSAYEELIEEVRRDEHKFMHFARTPDGFPIQVATLVDIGSRDTTQITDQIIGILRNRKII